MKKIFIFSLAVMLFFSVPVSAKEYITGYDVNDNYAPVQVEKGVYVRGISLTKQVINQLGATSQIPVTLDGHASTTPTYLTTATSTKSWTINTGGAKVIGLDVQLTASSSNAAAGLNIDLDVSQDGIDWFDYYNYDLSTLEATTTPNTVIASTTPNYSWYPGTTNVQRRRFNFYDLNANYTRFNFGLASTTLLSSIWAQAVKGY